MQARRRSGGGCRAEGLSGQIRIGAPDGCANFLLPQVCAAIADDNPELEVQIVALPRVLNLSKREADMAIAVSRADGRAADRAEDHRLPPAPRRQRELPRAARRRSGSRADLQRAPHRRLHPRHDLRQGTRLPRRPRRDAPCARLELGRGAVPLAAAGAGLGIVHDFALPSAPGMVRVLPDEISLTRSFYLVRHADDRRLARMNRFAAALADGSAARDRAPRRSGLTELMRHGGRWKQTSQFSGGEQSCRYTRFSRARRMTRFSRSNRMLWSKMRPRFLRRSGSARL